MQITPAFRSTDKYGSGEFGAPRGDHSHNGIDFVVAPLQPVLALVEGTVTKLGYPYTDDLSYRYVQVTDLDGNDVRYFYTLPTVEVGDTISIGDMLGTAQDLGERYPGITPHVHLEIKQGREYLNPNLYFGLL